MTSTLIEGNASMSENGMVTSGKVKAIKKRENWSHRLDFLFSCVGYAVGLGNIWRFPYLCYRNGGAAFLVPYLVFLVLCGMPLFFLEVAFGQFASLSPITIWRLSPLFKGVGYGMVIVSGITCIYYNVIIAWTLFYFFNSFSHELPWSSCNNFWNTPNCALLHHSTNSSSTTNFSRADLVMPSEEYWNHRVLQLTKGIEEPGAVRLELLGCLALAWLLVFLCLFKGIKSSGKVVYLTATFPYLVLFILLVRGITLPGAIDGIVFYLVPKVEKLLDLKVWGEAAMQIFYSMGAAWGALVTMASYNKFNHNCYRDAIVVPILNCATSIFAGFVIFAIIGFMAHETGSKVEAVVSEGPGLVFVVYPEAVSRMPFSPFWAVLFFLMLLSIGLDSQFGMFETVSSGFIDEFPRFLNGRKLLLTAVLCIVEFLLGILCITQGGIYFLQIMDWYCSTFSLMVLSFFECMAIAWIYGADRFYKDIELMIGCKPCIWWRICWQFITPLLIMTLLIYNIIVHSPVTYNALSYPKWAIAIGWMFAMCSIIPVPLYAIIKLSKASGSLVKRFKSCSCPSPDWGPTTERDRHLYMLTLKRDNIPLGDVVEEKSESNGSLLQGSNLQSVI